MGTVRPLTPNDLPEARKIGTVSSLAPKDAGRTDPTIFSDHRALRGVFDENNGNRMAALHRVLKRRMMLDGQGVQVGCISGYAARPEMKNLHGMDAKLMSETLREMHGQGLPLSWVFPHSYEFYRQFGYELGAQLTITDRVPLTHLLVEPQPAGAELLQPDDDTESLRACYQRFMADKNLALLRGDEEWNRFFVSDDLLGDVHIYAVRDARGIVTGYMRYAVEEIEGVKCARVTEMIYDAREAMLALLGKLRQMKDAYGFVILPVNPGMPLSALIASPYNACIKFTPCGIGRIVDAQAALLAVRAPAGRGAAVIATADTLLPTNNGPFRVCWEKGRIVSVERVSQTPDLFVPLNRLLQLVVGFISMREALLLPGVTLTGAHDELLSFFSRREGMLLDEF